MNSVNEIRGRLKNVFKNQRMFFNMNNIIHVTHLSRTRLNYWQKKGYITPISHKKNTNRVYSYPTLIKIQLIQSYLKSGYTLEMANKKASQGEQYGSFIHDLVMDRLQQIVNINGIPCADFGLIDNDSGKHIYFIKNNHGKIIAKVSSKKL